VASGDLNPLPEAHLRAIGCVVALWGALEAIVEECLLNAAGLSNKIEGYAIS
jgi:hypothetical protein